MSERKNGFFKFIMNCIGVVVLIGIILLLVVYFFSGDYTCHVYHDDMKNKAFAMSCYEIETWCNSHENCETVPLSCGARACVCQTGGNLNG